MLSRHLPDRVRVGARLTYCILFKPTLLVLALPLHCSVYVRILFKPTLLALALALRWSVRAIAYFARPSPSRGAISSEDPPYMSCC